MVYAKSLKKDKILNDNVDRILKIANMIYQEVLFIVYSDTINTICVNGNNEIRLWFNNCDDDLPEDKVVAYSDLEKLTERIITLEKSVRVKNNSDSNIGE